jgi:MSHA biogenesis protein MshJ
MGWRRLEARLLGLSLRERALVLLAALGALSALWDAAVLTPLHRAGAVRAAEQASLAERIASIELEAEQLRVRLAADPARSERERLRQLEQAVQALTVEVEGRSAGLVTPRQMTEALRALLDSTRGVQIVEVRALEPERLGPRRPGSASAVFRHGMELRFEADFAATLEFLERAERLPVQLFWSALEYELIQRSRARVLLRVHTLGAQEGWIGA